MPSKEKALKHATIVAAYLFIVWGFYRFMFKLPENVEELFIKPALWLIPVFYFVKKEKLGLGSLGITGKNLFSSIYFAIFLGVLFTLEGVLINYVKYGEMNFNANIGSRALLYSLVISLATAISEEITFRGFIYNRVWHALGKEWNANILTSIAWALVHIPTALFWWKLPLQSTFGLLILTTIFGIGSSFVFARTRNVSSSILLHIFWEWPIILFR
jgi:membrane protease YdiL (CAAX protease family)